MRPSRIITQTITKTKHFRWWNVFDDMCRMGRWSFWSWFVVNRSTIDIPQNSSPSYCCSSLCFRAIRSFCGFPISRKSETRNRRIDGQSAAVNVVPLGGLRNKRRELWNVEAMSTSKFVRLWSICLTTEPVYNVQTVLLLVIA